MLAQFLLITMGHSVAIYTLYTGTLYIVCADAYFLSFIDCSLFTQCLVISLCSLKDLVAVIQLKFPASVLSALCFVSYFCAFVVIQ